MVNVMEWLYSQEEYNTVEKRRGVKELRIGLEYLEGHLDLREFVNLTEIRCCSSNLTSLDLSKSVSLKYLDCSDNNLISLNVSCCVNLTYLDCHNNNLTSVDFLNHLPNPRKLETLWIFNNNIQPTDIAIFSKFVNLKELEIGTMKSDLDKINKFYGSLKSYQNLTNLWSICIEATDVNEGLEYLPFHLVQKSREMRYSSIQCSPHGTNAKCSAIQDQLRPFNYDLEAWQLAHPEKMLISRPEYFTNPDSKDKLLSALNNKILQVREEIITAKDQEANKLAKIARLEAKIQELTQAKSTISQQTQTEFTTRDQGTQTDLTADQITKLEKDNQQLLKLLQATETELTNTKQQLKASQDKDQAQIKQLQSKITLLEQQKTNYQTKYDKSIEFIKEIREEVAKCE